jgi:hypothetical protein
VNETWAERAQRDESLRAFVDAELVRGGIELDTLRYQVRYLRAAILTAIKQRDAARSETRVLRQQQARAQTSWRRAS